MSDYKSIADELITRGWTQGVIRDVDGRVCLRGAMTSASPYGGTEFFVMAEVVRGVIGSSSIGGWNDEPGRTFDEVLRVAKEADEILSERF